MRQFNIVYFYLRVIVQRYHHELCLFFFFAFKCKPACLSALPTSVTICGFYYPFSFLFFFFIMKKTDEKRYFKIIVNNLFMSLPLLTETTAGALVLFSHSVLTNFYPYFLSTLFLFTSYNNEVFELLNLL